MHDDPDGRAASTAAQRPVDRPTRGADRNRDCLDRADRSRDGSLLPALEAGITLLDVDGVRGVSALQSLVVDHLLGNDGPAFWVDADGHATTTTLARIAPSQRLLDRIHVARGFTAYQHYAAVRDLTDAVNGAIQRAASPVADGPRRRRVDCDRVSTPSIVVVPAVDARYRAEDALHGSHAATLLSRTLARLRSYAEGYGAPVLVTRTERDAFTTPVERAADHRLRCEQTRMGPRFVGEEFETLVYPVGDGAYFQTTVAYWQQLLAARADQVGIEPAADLDSTGAGVGAGVTAGGDTATLTPDPMLDAWNAGVGGR